MAIVLPSGFNITNNEPVDARLSVANQTARLGFSAANVYEGLVVYQQDTNELYVLIDIASYNSTVGWQLVGSNVNTGSLVTTSSFNAWTGSASSIFYGTASFATTASFTVSSSRAVSSSFATTASYALNAANGGVTSINVAGSGLSINQSTGAVTITSAGGGGGSAFPFIGNALITGSLRISGSMTSSADIIVAGLNIGTGPSTSTPADKLTNVSIGSGSRQKGTTGTYNVAIASNAMQNATAASYTVAIGGNSLKTLTTANYNIAIGGNSMALLSDANAGENIAIGYASLEASTAASKTIAIGSYAARVAPASAENIAIGQYAMTKGNSATNAVQSVAIGSLAMSASLGSRNSVAIGYAAMANNNFEAATAAESVAIGSQAMRYHTRAVSTIAIGKDALLYNYVSGFNVAIGAESLSGGVKYVEATGSIPSASFTGGSPAYTFNFNYVPPFSQTGIGGAPTEPAYSISEIDTSIYDISCSFSDAIDAAANSATVTKAGTGFTITLASPLQIGGSVNWYYRSSQDKRVSSNNTVIGYQSMKYFLGSTTPWTRSGQRLMTGRGEGGNLALGYRALYGLDPTSTTIPAQFKTGSGGQYNVALGYTSLYHLYLGSENLAIGYRALEGKAASPIRGNGNMAMGALALASLETGDENLAMGIRALTGPISSNYDNYRFRSGSGNVALGRFAGGSILSGSNNVAIGSNAMGQAVRANNNVAIGPEALFSNHDHANLNGNVAIGYQAGYFLSSNVSQSVIIGYQAGPTDFTNGSGASNRFGNGRLIIHNTASANPLIDGRFTERTLTINGTVTVSGSIIPVVNASGKNNFTLGTPERPWSASYFSKNSVHFIDDNGDELAKISAAPNQIILPDIYTAGTFTAQTFVTQSTTIIVEQYHATGSNIFGSSSLDTHQFTGSMFVSGAMYVSDIQPAFGYNIITFNTGSGRLYYTSSLSLVGPQGPAGSSAYDAWIGLGNSGTEQNFIDSLVGATGPSGSQGNQGPEGIQGQIGLTGPPGPVGSQGPQGDPGIGFTQIDANTVGVSYNTQITGSLTVGQLAVPALYNTAYGISTVSPITVYSLSTASYDSLFLDYTIKSGSNMRAGQMTATWLNSQIVYNEVATVDIGSTVGANLSATLTDSTASINFTTPNAGWTVKTIIRSI